MLKESQIKFQEIQSKKNLNGSQIKSFFEQQKFQQYSVAYQNLEKERLKEQKGKIIDLKPFFIKMFSEEVRAVEFINREFVLYGLLSKV